MSVLFFLYSSRAHRDLHSFPTRRSSDLTPDGLPYFAMKLIKGRTLAELLKERPGPAHDRSEEHTSELQSRVDLVCRLLLEKKKNNRSTLSGQGRMTRPGSRVAFLTRRPA